MAVDYTKTSFNASEKQTHYDWGLRKYILGVYQYMAIALALTGIIAFGASSSQQFMYTIHATGLKWVIFLAPLGIVYFMGSRLMSMSITTAQACLMIFAALMGLSLSSIFMIYTGYSIAKVFFITAGTFGAMSLYGFQTKRDLTHMGSFLVMGLIGIIIATLANIFIKSSMMEFIISAIGVIIFTLFTAYDSQKIKTIYYQTQGNDEIAAKLAVYGSLSLYMDFVNLFIFLLQFLGARRSD